jgi:hypothetical protein
MILERAQWRDILFMVMNFRLRKDKMFLEQLRD